MRFLRTLAISTLAGGSLLGLTQAQANTIKPKFLSVTPTILNGQSVFDWHYTTALTGDDTFIKTGSEVTLYDFYGLVTAKVDQNFVSSSGSFAYTTSTVGPTPGNTLPVDTAVPNVTFTYTGDQVNATVNPLFTFDVYSIYGVQRIGEFTSSDNTSLGPQGTIGNVILSSPIPEPAFVQLGSLLALGGVGGMFQLRRKRRKA